MTGVKEMANKVETGQVWQETRSRVRVTVRDVYPADLRAGYEEAHIGVTYGNGRLSLVKESVFRRNYKVVEPT